MALSEQQKKYVLEGGVLADNPDYADFVKANQAGSAITSASLTSSTDLSGQVQQPAEQPITPPSSLEVPEVKTQPSVATPTETSIESLLKSIQGTQESLGGETAFTAKKEEEFGVPQAEQTIQDLATQLRDLQREEKAIPLTVQQEFAGRGVTRAGAAPIETGRLRENAIRALTVSSSLDAASGLLASANRKVERAVAQEFGQKKEDLKIKLANLELLLKSPALTREQKDRALAQQVNLKTQQDALTKQEKAKEEAQKKVNDLISLNQGKISATQIEDIRKLTNETDVLNYAIEKGLLTEKEEKVKAVEPLNILDVARYNELYPEAGVTVGDTEVQANAKIQALNTPEAKIRNLVLGAKENNNTLEDVLKEIETDNTIKDKELAKKIAQEVFGIGKQETIIGAGTIPTTGILSSTGTPSALGGLQASESFANTLSNFLFKPL